VTASDEPLPRAASSSAPTTTAEDKDTVNRDLTLYNHGLAVGVLGVRSRRSRCRARP